MSGFRLFSKLFMECAIQAGQKQERRPHVLGLLAKVRGDAIVRPTRVSIDAFRLLRKIVVDLPSGFTQGACQRSRTRMVQCR
jgi:hypothetical protein